VRPPARRLGDSTLPTFERPPGPVGPPACPQSKWKVLPQGLASPY
jgi:hypothetical protein